MELLLAQIARRCLRNATRARRTLVYATERCDHQDVACAHFDLVFAGAVARAAVARIDHHRRRGEIDAMAAARIGLDLVTTLRLVETAPPHLSGVMFSGQEDSYHRPDVAETVHESDGRSPASTLDATTNRIRTIEAPADV